MRLLVISAAFPPMKAGEADHALHLCQHLAQRGLEIHVLTGREAEANGGVPFKVHSLMRDWSWSELPRLAKFLKDCAPDGVLLIYSGWVYKSHPMITFLPTLSKILLPRIPFVTQIEIEYTSLKAPLPVRTLLKALQLCAGSKRVHPVLGTLLKGSDRIIVLSERHKDKLLAEFPALNGKSLAIPPPALMPMCSENGGGDRDQLRRALGIKSAEFLIAYFGYVYRGKGVETLLHALRILKDRSHQARLVVVGGGIDLSRPTSYIQSLFDLADQIGIKDRIIWTGEYESNSIEPSKYLYASDACVLPFDKGVALNRSSLAAVASHGLPIVTTRGDLLESAFIDRKNVYLCPPKNPEAIALAVSSLIDNPSLRETLRLGALELANQWFSWDKAMDRTLEALRATAG